MEESSLGVDFFSAFSDLNNTLVEFCTLVVTHLTRLRHGWTNKGVEPPSKTTKEIVHENVFTYFNLIFVVLAVLLCLVGSFRDLTFLPVIIANTLIGIIQEIRAKQVLDKLTMLNAPRASVVRDGKRTVINAEDLSLIHI